MKFKSVGLERAEIGKAIPQNLPIDRADNNLDRFDREGTLVELSWAVKENGKWIKATENAFEAGKEYRLRLDAQGLWAAVLNPFKKDIVPKVIVNDIELSVVTDDDVNDSIYNFRGTTTIDIIMYSAPFKLAEQQLGKEYGLFIENGDARKEGSDKVVDRARAGEKINITVEDPRDGQVFDKWVVKKSSLKLAHPTAPIAEFILPDEEVSIAATYKDDPNVLKEHSITIDGGKAIDGTTQKEIKTAIKGTEVTIQAEQPVGKVFNGWEVLEGNVAIDDKSEETTFFEMPSENVKIKATYKEDPAPMERYSISYDLNGGNFNGETKTRVIVAKKGEVINLLDAPTKDGHQFISWKGKEEYKAGASYTVNENQIFVAQWEKLADE